MLRALLFDFNGVLVDDEPLHLDLILQILGDEGVDIDRSWAADALLGQPDRAALDLAMARGGRAVDPHELTELVERKGALYREQVAREGFRFFPGALRLAHEAADGGLMLGVVSGARRGEIEGALAQEGITPLFKAVIAAEDLDAGKPDPTGYLLALEALNSRPPLPDRLVHPHEALAIEDSIPGLAAAQDAGLVTLGICHSQPAEHLAFADAVRPDLEVLNLPCLQAIYAKSSRR